MNEIGKRSFVWSLDEERKTVLFVRDRLFTLCGMLAYFAGAWEGKPNSPRLIDITRRLRAVEWDLDRYLSETAPPSED